MPKDTAKLCDETRAERAQISRRKSRSRNSISLVIFETSDNAPYVTDVRSPIRRKGTVTPETHLKGDIFGKYEEAVQQAPADNIPFLIFIDVNVPASFRGPSGHFASL